MAELLGLGAQDWSLWLLYLGGLVALGLDDSVLGLLLRLCGLLGSVRGELSFVVDHVGVSLVLCTDSTRAYP